MGVQAFQLGLDPWSRCRPRQWKQKVQDASAAARTTKLTELVASGLQDGSSRGDAAYLQSVTSSGQVGSWAKLVPAFGARINYRRLRLGLLEGTAKMVARRVPGSTEAICRKIGAQAFECPVCPGVEETGTHVALDCPQHQHVWAAACAKATNAEGTIGTPAEQGWRALGLEGQKAHLLSSEGVSPPEVERRLRGVATKALVDGFHEVNVGLNLGHAALREKISAEVQRLAAIKEAAKAAAKEAGAQGPASCGQAPQGMPVAQEAAIPAQDGQESQQDALQESRDPTEGVPPAGKAGPQPKVQRAAPSAVAAAAVKAKALERKRTKKPRKKKTQKKKTL